MSATPSPEEPWSGDMLDSPPMVEAWTTQLRRVLAGHADYVAGIRRDAEAMWAANPPEGYSSFEAWWRHRQLTSPFREIQEHLEKAAALTFQVEARYRKTRHVLPAARQAVQQARQAPAIPSPAARPVQRSPAPAAPRPVAAPAGDFMSMVQKRSKSA